LSSCTVSVEPLTCKGGDNHMGWKEAVGQHRWLRAGGLLRSKCQLHHAMRASPAQSAQQARQQRQRKPPAPAHQGVSHQDLGAGRRHHGINGRHARHALRHKVCGLWVGSWFWVTGQPHSCQQAAVRSLRMLPCQPTIAHARPTVDSTSHSPPAPPPALGSLYKLAPRPPAEAGRFSRRTTPTPRWRGGHRPPRWAVARGGRLPAASTCAGARTSSSSGSSPRSRRAAAPR